MNKPMGKIGRGEEVLRDRYPRPPYRKQSQPWPGFACKMDPRPDQGEASARGSGRLLGRKAAAGSRSAGRAAARLARPQ